MMRKRFKKIFKLIVLISVRQLWKLADNLYDLLSMPVLAIRKVWKNKDKSQIFLIFFTAFLPIITYVIARIIWDTYKYKHILMSGGLFFSIVTIIEIIILSYLGFWIWKSSKRE